MPESSVRVLTVSPALTSKPRGLPPAAEPPLPPRLREGEFPMPPGGVLPVLCFWRTERGGLVCDDDV